MSREEAYQRSGRGLSMGDIDNFRDLEWESDMMEARRSQARRKRPANLSATIEDYLRSHF